MIRPVWTKALVAVVVLSVFGVGAYGAKGMGKTGAERLVERLPEDVIGFAATSGGMELTPGFDRSQMGQIWHEASVQDFYQKVKEAGMSAAWKDQAKDKHDFEVVAELIKQIVRCPTVIAVSPRPGMKKSSPICGFVIAEAEKNRAAIDDAIAKFNATEEKPQKILDLNFGGTVMHGVKEDDQLVYWGWLDGYFLLAINDEAGKLVFDLKTKTAATTQPAARWPVSKVPGSSDAFVLAVDVEKIFSLFLKRPETKELEKVEPILILKKLGIRNIRTVMCRWGFSGPDMVGDDLLALSETDEGIFGCLRTVDLSQLDLIPAGVTGAMAYNLDFGGLYDMFLETIKIGAEKDSPHVDKKIEEFQAKVKIDVRRDLVGNLAGPMVTYALPAAAMNPLAGSGVFLFKLKDAKAFEKALTAVEGYVAGECDGQFQATEQEMDGVKYHFWMIPQLAMVQVSPCWAISGNMVVFGTNMSSVAAAVRYAKTPNAEKTSLRAMDEFKQMAKVLPPRLIAFKYVDQKRQAEETLQVAQQFWPMAVMALNKESKVKLPMMLPPTADIVKHLGPQVAYSWITPDGIRSHSRGPAIGSDLSTVAVTGFVAGSMMPAVGRARETAKRVNSATHLKQIYTACYMYANDKKGKFPDTLQQLIEMKYLDKVHLDSPLKPKDFTGPSYIYIPGLEADSDPRNILAYENPAYQSEGTNVLHADGHAQWTKPEEFKAALAETYKRLGRPMPEVKFQSGKGGWNLGNLLKSDKTATQPTTKPKFNL